MNSNTHYSLGGNFTLPASQFASPASGTTFLPPTPTFGFTFSPTPPPAPTPVFNLNIASGSSPTMASVPLPVFQLPSLSDPKPPSIGLVTGTAKAFLKNDLPPAVRTVGVVASAAMTAKKLTNSIDQALDKGQPTGEAYTCQTVKVFAEEFSGKAIKGAIVNGIPPYLTAATTSPALAASVPFVLPLIPVAYQGAQAAAEFVGGAAEAGCHSAFDLARQLSNAGGVQ